jgi:hypothetical protein
MGKPLPLPSVSPPFEITAQPRERERPARALNTHVVESPVWKAVQSIVLEGKEKDEEGAVWGVSDFGTKAR